jgi:DNA repair protein RadC
LNIDCEFYEETLQQAAHSDRALLIEVLRCTNCRRRAEKLASALFERFGNYRRIMLSRHEVLLDVEGMTENAAELICLLQNTYRKSMIQKDRLINTYAGPMSSFIGQLIGSSLEEELWVAGFDELGILRACDRLEHGDINSLHFHVRVLLEYASRHRLNVISVAHNHPDGSLGDDNGADKETLRMLHNILRAFHIQLQEYIVLEDELHVYTCREPDPASCGDLQEQRGNDALHQLADMIAGKTYSETVQNG